MRKILFAVLLLLPSWASAQTSSSFEITPFAAYRWGGQLDTEVSDLFNVDVEVEESAAYGITFDIPLNYGFQVELMANRQQSEFKVDRGLFEDDREIADVDLTYYHVGGLWQWGDGQVNPFVVLSGGVTEIAPDLPGVDSEHRLSGSLGGGAKIFFNQHFGLRLEGRGYWTDLASDDDNDFCNRCDDEGENDLYQGEARVGFILAF